MQSSKLCDRYVVDLLLLKMMIASIGYQFTSPG